VALWDKWFNEDGRAAGKAIAPPSVRMGLKQIFCQPRKTVHMKRVFRPTPEQMKKIVSLREMGITAANVAQRFGVRRAVISKIVSEYRAALEAQSATKGESRT